MTELVFRFQHLKYNLECSLGSQGAGVSILVPSLMTWVIRGKATNFLSAFSFFFFLMELIVRFLKGWVPGWRDSSVVADDRWRHHDHHSLPTHSAEELNVLQHQHNVV